MEIFLSPLAARKIEILVSFLEEEWSTRVKNEFIKKLKEKFKQIASNPKSCIRSAEVPNLYKCVVTKQTSFLYRIVNDEIEVITLTDNRQDPEQIIEEIKRYFA